MFFSEACQKAKESYNFARSGLTAKEVEGAVAKKTYEVDDED